MKLPPPQVSIIIPCYQQAQYLPDALASVLAQTYPQWEAIIVDDGSPDNTEAVASSFLAKDSRFRYLKQDNKGLSTARNAGILSSHGEYLLPLDADDMLYPSYLEKAIDHFNHHPETKLVYCKAELFGEQCREWDIDEYHYDSLLWGNCIFCSAIFRRSDYDTTDGYNPNMTHGLEDWDFWLSLLKREDIVYRIDEILFRYRIKKASMSTRLSAHAEEMYIQIYKNHKELYEPYLEDYMNRIVLNRGLPTRMREAENEIERLRNTYAYRIGKILMRPFSWRKK